MEKEGLNVLSTFNGMGCAWLAFEKAGIRVKSKFSSEIEKNSIIVNDFNYPDTIQLGDVSKITKQTFGDLSLDIIVGGSPC